MFLLKAMDPFIVRDVCLSSGKRNDVYEVSGSVRCFHAPSGLWDRPCFPHFSGEETKVQKAWTIGLPSKWWCGEEPRDHACPYHLEGLCGLELQAEWAKGWGCKPGLQCGAPRAAERRRTRVRTPRPRKGQLPRQMPQELHFVAWAKELLF